MNNKISKDEKAKQNWTKLKVRLILFLQFQNLTADSENFCMLQNKPKRKWYESGHFVIKHDSRFVMTIYIIFSISYLIEFFLVPYLIAFKFALLSQWESWSTILDILACLDFVTHFFIEQEVLLQDKKYHKADERFYRDNK